jgi:hypothetical protein
MRACVGLLHYKYVYNNRHGPCTIYLLSRLVWNSDSQSVLKTVFIHLIRGQDECGKQTEH